jgi:hypothetical protein
MCKTCGKHSGNNRQKVCILRVYILSLHPPIRIPNRGKSRELNKTIKNNDKQAGQDAF